MSEKPVRIAEIFHSIQGEGPYAGTSSVFIRTSGCNLRCWFCDTPYTSWYPEGESLAVQTIVDQVAAFGTQHIVITGGEPLLHLAVIDLSRILQERGHFITFETAGTVYLPVAADLLAVSPKLSNSVPNDPLWSSKHNRTRVNHGVMTQLIDEYNCHFKFVIDQPADVDEVVKWLSDYSNIESDRVWLMPQATTSDDLRDRAEWVALSARQHQFRYSPRLHIEQFGNRRGV